MTDEVLEKTKVNILEAFNEDKDLLEQIHTLVSDDPRGLDFPEINLGADGAGVRVRQVLKRKLEAERTS